MSMGMQSGQSQQQSSQWPVDMTPSEFAALRGPLVQMLGSLMGFDPQQLMEFAAKMPRGGMGGGAGDLMGGGGGSTFNLNQMPMRAPGMGMPMPMSSNWTSQWPYNQQR